MTPTPEQEEAARNFARDWPVRVGFVWVDMVESLAKFLAARDAEKDRVIAELRKTIQGEMSDPNGSIWEAHSAALRRAEQGEASLAALRQPVGSDEEREALAWFSSHGTPDSRDKAWKFGCLLARKFSIAAERLVCEKADRTSLRDARNEIIAKTAALKEAEEKIAALEKKS